MSAVARSAKKMKAPWIPLALMVGIGLLSAIGIGTASAIAGSASTVVTVTGNVGASASLGNSCAGALAIADMTAGGPIVSSFTGAGSTNADCTLTFGTNNGTTTTLNVVGSTSPFFKSAGNSFTNANATCVTELSLPAGEMGMEIPVAPAGGPTPVISPTWCLGGAPAQTKVGPIVIGGTNFCAGAGIGVTSTCVVRMVAHPAAAQPSGAYTGTATFNLTTS